MLRAAAEGDLPEIDRLLTADPGLANCAYAYVSPLHFAVREGHTAVVQRLLAAGANPMGACALHSGTDPVAVAADRNLPVIVGILAETMRALFGTGAPGREMCDAVQDGDGERVQALLEIVHLLYAHGAAAGLVSHVWQGRLDVVGELLKVDPNLINSGGDFSPLCAAVGNASMDMVRLLLRYKPDLNRPSYWGNHVLYACGQRDLPDRLDVLRLLLDHGADPNHRNWLGISYLHLQALRGDLDTAAMLLERGADIHARDEEWGSTPLGWAARWGQKTMVEFLLARGAEPALADDPPWATPLAWAEKKRHPDIAAVLRDAGAPR